VWHEKREPRPPQQGERRRGREAGYRGEAWGNGEKNRLAADGKGEEREGNHCSFVKRDETKPSARSRIFLEGGKRRRDRNIKEGRGRIRQESAEEGRQDSWRRSKKKGNLPYKWRERRKKSLLLTESAQTPGEGKFHYILSEGGDAFPREEYTRLREGNKPM